MKKHIAYICAGSNLGDKLSNCKNGIDALIGSGECILKKQSKFYQTEPLEYQDQDWFINVVVKIETSFDPVQLLHRLKSIERMAGRTVDPIKFGPRILDLDIIFYDDLVISTAQLVIPHPRMHKRRFVLEPVCDIDSTIVHPVFKKDVRHLLDLLEEDGQGVVEYPCGC